MTDVTNQLLAQITEIKNRFDADPDAFLAATADLRDSDFALMGKLIQLYCYADLNARRIIDALRHAALGPEARHASRLQDAQVFPKLREVAESLSGSNLKDGLLKAADAIEMHRIHRHILPIGRLVGLAAKRLWSSLPRMPERPSAAMAIRKSLMS